MTLYPSSLLSADKPVVGDKIQIKDNVMKAYCTARVTSLDPTCVTWAYFKPESVTIEMPTNPTKPIVTISSPSVIGVCDPVPFDLTSSVGSSGRPWTNIVYSVQSSTINSTDALNMKAWFESEYSFYPPSDIPRTLLVPGSRYNVVVRLCNFLGFCSQEQHQFTVLKDVKPFVNIPGFTRKKIYRNLPLKLTSSAYTVECSSDTSNITINYENLQYNWKIMKSDTGQLLSELVSKSINPSVLYLPAYSFEVGEIYEAVLEVKSTKYFSSSTAIITLAVQESGIIAQLKGGLLQYIRSGEYITLDASGSYDADTDLSTATSKELISAIQKLNFQWSCIQLEPFLSNYCRFKIVRSTYAPYILSVIGNSGTPGTLSEIKLTVFDGTRSSSVFLSMRGLSAIEPTVSLWSLTPTYMNVNSPLKLQGKINATSIGNATWSVDNTDIDLSNTNNVLTSIKKPFAADDSGGIFLVLNPNVLGIRASYIFTLTADIARAGTSTGSIQSYATVKIETNGPPIPGVLDISPLTGIALQTQFILSASLWHDSDLPLSYIFYYIDPSSLKKTVIQSRSETSYGSTKLPSGDVDKNSSIACGVMVYDNLDAVSNKLHYGLNVYKLTLSELEMQEFLLASIEMNAGDSVDKMKQQVALGTSTINNVDCSNAPNCTSLHRLSCKLKAQTCGVCKQTYIGESGPGNTICIANIVSTITNTNTLNTSNTIGNHYNVTRIINSGICVHDTDCDAFERCNSNSICSIMNKECPSSCSGNGYCGYFDVNTDEALLSCPENNLKCKPYCVCNNGYAGSSCSETEENMNSKSNIRGKVLEALSVVVNSEDPSEDSIADWVEKIVSITQNPDELSTLSIEIASNITQKILVLATSIGISYRTTIILVEVMNTLVDLRTISNSPTMAPTSSNSNDNNYNNNNRRNLLSRRRLSTDSKDKLESTMDLVGNSMMNEMVIGQNSIEVVESNFRMSAVAAVISGSDSEIKAEFSPPRTSLEKIMGTILDDAIITIVSNDTQNQNKKDEINIKMTILSSKVKLYDEEIAVMNINSTFSAPTSRRNNSNPNMTSSAVISQERKIVSNGLKTTIDCSVAGSADKVIYFTIPHIKDARFGLKENQFVTNFTTHCKRKHIESFYYYCFDTDETLRVDCNGRKKKIVTLCPIVVRSPACYVPNSDVECDLVKERSTSNSTVCECKLCDSSVSAVASRKKRRLQMEVELNEKYPQLSQSQHRKLNIEQTNQVVTIAAMSEYTVAQFGDTLSESNSYTIEDLITNNPTILYCFSTVWIVLPLLFCIFQNLFDTEEDEKVEAVRVRSQLNEDIKYSERENTDHSKQIEVILRFSNYVRTLIPDIYDPKKTAYEKLKNALLNNNQYLSAIAEDNLEKKIIKMFHICTYMTASLFVLVILYDLQFPSDNGTCIAILEKSGCTSIKSLIDSEQNQCTWNTEYRECSFQEVDPTPKAAITLSFLMMVIVTPLNALVDVLFFNILLAPTAKDIDKITESTLSKAGTAIAIKMRRASSAFVNGVNNTGRRVMAGVGKFNVRAESSESTKREVLQYNKTQASWSQFINIIPLMSDQAINAKASLTQIIQNNPIAMMQMKTQRDKFSKTDLSTSSNIKPQSSFNQRFEAGEKGINNHNNRDTLLNNHTLANFQQKKNIEYEDIEAQIMLFRTNLLKHRNAMRIREAVQEFDKKWDLTMINDGIGKSTALVKGEKKYYFGTKSQYVMNKSIGSCLKQSSVELKKFKQLPPSLRGPEILRIFLMDMIGRETEECKVLQNNLYDDFNYVVSWLLKCFTIALVFILNLYMMYMILLYGATKGILWQNAWAINALINCCVDFFFSSNVEAIVVFYFIPSLVTKDVYKIQKKVSEIIDKMFSYNLTTKESSKRSTFSSTDYFFLSNNIAKDFPSLDESALVLSYRDPLPIDPLRRQWLSKEVQDYENKLEIFDREYREGKISEIFHPSSTSNKSIKSMNKKNIKTGAWKREIIKEHGDFIDPRSTKGKRKTLIKGLYSSFERSIRAALSFLISMFLTLGSTSLLFQRNVVALVSPMCLTALVYAGYTIYNNKILFYTLATLLSLAIIVLTSKGWSGIRRSDKKQHLVHQENEKDEKTSKTISITKSTEATKATKAMPMQSLSQLQTLSRKSRSFVGGQIKLKSTISSTPSDNDYLSDISIASSSSSSASSDKWSSSSSSSASSSSASSCSIGDEDANQKDQKEKGKEGGDVDSGNNSSVISSSCTSDSESSESDSSIFNGLESNTAEIAAKALGSMNMRNKSRSKISNNSSSTSKMNEMRAAMKALNEVSSVVVGKGSSKTSTRTRGKTISSSSSKTNNNKTRGGNAFSKLHYSAVPAFTLPSIPNLPKEDYSSDSSEGLGINYDSDLSL